MPYAEHEGIQTFYEVEGNGPPLLLHHGLTSRSNVWHLTGYVDALKNDFTLILIDSRGHGLSDRPKNPSEYAPGKRSGDLIAVLDELGINRSHYLGYSLGGRIGFELAYYATEWILSFAAGGARPQPSPGIYEGLVSNGLKGLLARLPLLTKGQPEEFAEQILKDVMDNDLEALIAAVHPEIYDQERIYRQGLLRLKGQILMFSGDADPAHDDAKAMCRILPKATFLSLPAEDHLTAVRAGLTSVTDWLNANR